MDWSIVHETGAVFENMIAVSLTRMAARLTETGTGDFEIKHEVDFVLIKDNSPLCLFEAKEGSREISRSGRSKPLLPHSPSIPGNQIIPNG